MTYLLILEGPDVDRRIELDKASKIIIGRSPRCSVVLRDREVSRRHAELAASDDGFFVRDLGSSNGTNVNGDRITTHVLSDRDRIQIGRNLMIFVDKGPMLPTGVANRSLGIDKSTDFFDIQIIDTSNDESPAEDNLSHIRHAVEVKRTTPDDNPSHDPANLVRERSGTPGYVDVAESSEEYWQMMYRAVISISRTSDLPELVQQILAMIFQWIQCDRACILLQDPVTKVLKPAGRLDRKPSAKGSALQISQTILDYVTRTGEAVLTGDAISDQRWDVSASIAQAGVREAICVPMPGRHGLVGVIYIDTSASLGKVTDKEKAELLNVEHLKLLSAIAHHAALVVEDAYNYQTMLRSERLAAMGTVIASISHHIKNILQGIEGGSFLVTTALQRGDLQAIDQGWKVVEKNQRRIKALVLDMLAYGKERQPQMAEHEMNEIVKDAIDLLMQGAAEQGVKLVFDKKPPTARIYGDEDAIYHAIVNLITNAVEACTERRKNDCDAEYKPAVEVEVRANRGHVEMIVTDNGKGMDAAQMERVFVAFESTKGARGSGLGLAVSRKIINEHGGNILVNSELDKGTTFTIQLPADVDVDQSRNLNEQTIAH